MPGVHVSIGSNINRALNVRRALEALRERFGPIRRSSVYETTAVGFPGKPFYNLVVHFTSDENPQALKRQLRAIEAACGRSRTAPMPGPCPLDLDLLLYGNWVVDTVELRLPRPDVLRHAFVLEPLAELDPDLRYPGAASTYAELWATYRRERPAAGGQRLFLDPLPALAERRNWCFPDYTLPLSG